MAIQEKSTSGTKIPDALLFSENLHLTKYNVHHIIAFVETTVQARVHFCSAGGGKETVPNIPHCGMEGCITALRENIPKGGDTYTSSNCCLDCNDHMVRIKDYRLDKI
jgi:hypothetical protein